MRIVKNNTVLLCLHTIAMLKNTYQANMVVTEPLSQIFK